MLTQKNLFLSTNSKVMLITGNFTGKPAVNTRYGLGGILFFVEKGFSYFFDDIIIKEFIF
jgi:hypothetical protein